jgi:hypothetical protein
MLWGRQAIKLEHQSGVQKFIVQSTLMLSLKFQERIMHGSFQQVAASHTTAVEKIWNG